MVLYVTLLNRGGEIKCLEGERGQKHFMMS